MSHTDLDEKMDNITLLALEQGGYLVTGGSREFGRAPGPGGAFSTLPEALDWLQRNMKQPEPQRGGAIDMGGLKAGTTIRVDKHLRPLDDMSQGRTLEETEIMQGIRDAQAMMMEQKRQVAEDIRREQIERDCRRIMDADPRTFPPKLKKLYPSGWRGQERVWGDFPPESDPIGSKAQ